MPPNLCAIPTKRTTIMPTWHMLQLMMMMMKVMADVDAKDEEDGDEMKNNDIYEAEMEVEDYHSPYVIKTSVSDSDDNDNCEDNDEQCHL